MNEYINTTNNIVEPCGLQRNTCVSKLARILDDQALKKCKGLKERNHSITIMHNGGCLKGTSIHGTATSGESRTCPAPLH